MTRGVMVGLAVVGLSGCSDAPLVPSPSTQIDPLPVLEGFVGDRLWSGSNPTFYIQSESLSSTERGMMRDVITIAVPLFTGDRYQAGHIEFGLGKGVERDGQIRILIEPTGASGSAITHGRVGVIFLNPLKQCSDQINADVVGHEIGHTMGYHHVEGPYLMRPRVDCSNSLRGRPTPIEIAHARAAYRR